MRLVEPPHDDPELDGTLGERVDAIDVFHQTIHKSDQAKIEILRIHSKWISVLLFSTAALATVTLTMFAILVAKDII